MKSLERCFKYIQNARARNATHVVKLHVILMRVYDIAKYLLIVSKTKKKQQNYFSKLLTFFLISQKFISAQLRRRSGGSDEMMGESAAVTHLIKALQWLIIIVAISVIAILIGLIALWFRRRWHKIEKIRLRQIFGSKRFTNIHACYWWCHFVRYIEYR